MSRPLSFKSGPSVAENYPEDMRQYDTDIRSPYNVRDPETLDFDAEEDYDDFSTYQESLQEEEQYQYKQDILHDR